MYGRLYITTKGPFILIRQQSIIAEHRQSRPSYPPEQTYSSPSTKTFVPISLYSSSSSSPTVPNNSTTSGKCTRSILFSPSTRLFTTRPNRLFVTFRSSSGSVQHRWSAATYTRECFLYQCARFASVSLRTGRSEPETKETTRGTFCLDSGKILVCGLVKGGSGEVAVGIGLGSPGSPKRNRRVEIKNPYLGSPAVP